MRERKLQMEAEARMTPKVTVTAILSTALLLLVSETLSTESSTKDPTIKLTVFNSILKEPNITYHAPLVQRGILLGAMRKLQESSNFKFTTEDNINYGPYLVSVNGVAGNNKDSTYWELLAEATDGTIIRPDVGVGCFIPSPQQHVILKYTKW